MSVDQHEEVDYDLKKPRICSVQEYLDNSPEYSILVQLGRTVEDNMYATCRNRTHRLPLGWCSTVVVLFLFL